MIELSYLQAQVLYGVLARAKNLLGEVESIDRDFKQRRSAIVHGLETWERHLLEQMDTVQALQSKASDS